MERSIIESMTCSLPRSKFGEIVSQDAAWEETDGRAHFIVSRQVWASIPTHEILALSVSGEPHERTRIVQEFSEVFGPPFTADDDTPDTIDIYLWLVPQESTG